ncbi:hypothetical protein NDU88_002091 [Pleurodeles waltl]|uniref:DDE Tnp4 domain-containing protein n=1 Tax=Pleurodeles waltl TaxID=8319 RepID=A0AAV7UUK4_PLEWA|nr:hypothetical protein NDU88_002091 [Pleurodeles waltl]
MSGWGIEGELSVEVFWYGVVQCLVSVDEEYEGDSLVDGEPMQVSQVGCDVAVPGDVQAEACSGVLDALQSFLEFARGSCSHVDIEEGQTLGYAADDFGGFRAKWREADSLSSACEKGGNPVQGSVAESCVTEAGDSAYALRPWMLTPYLTPSNETERQYNSAYKRTRNIIERTFGLLKARFRCLHRSGGALQYTPITAFKIVVACAILHNIATRRGLPLTPEDPDSEDEEQELPHRHHRDRSIANQGRLRREHIANQYFGRYVLTVTILTNVTHKESMC